MKQERRLDTAQQFASGSQLASQTGEPSQITHVHQQQKSRYKDLVNHRTMPGILP